MNDRRPSEVLTLTGQATSVEVRRERHLVECFINKTKHYRRIFSRFEKLDTRYLGFLHFTAYRRSHLVAVKCQHNLEQRPFVCATKPLTQESRSRGGAFSRMRSSVSIGFSPRAPAPQLETLYLGGDRLVGA